jgi:hypothetical protein
MKYCLCLCLLAVVFSFNVLASSTDGHSLLKALEGKEKDDLSYRSGFFDGYVVGVADISANILWCPPKNVSRGQISKIVASYLKSHPEKLHMAANSLVIDALKLPFPCKKD